MLGVDQSVRMQTCLIMDTLLTLSVGYTDAVEAMAHREQWGH